MTAEHSTQTTTYNPWPPVPDVTAQIPEAIRHVLADRLAGMLLAPQNSEIQLKARELTFALKAEGFDLSDAIKKNITDLTLGPDPVDVPF